MNEPIIFWRNWNKNEKYSLLLLFIVLSALTIYCLVSWYLGLGNIMKWDVLSEQHEKVVSTKFFTQNNISFSASSPVMYVKEKFLPSLVHVNYMAYYALLGFGLLGLSAILTGLNRLNGTYFLVGAMALGLILVAFRFENVFLLNNNWSFLIAFVLLGGLYYLINICGLKLTNFNILSCWAIAFLILILGVYKFTKINMPLMSLAAYGSIGFLIISLVFIFFISHEIFAALLRLVTNNSQKGRSFLGQFLLISVVFFANVALIFLENAKLISDSIFILHPIVIFIISLILGFWGFKNTLAQQQSLSFKQSGLWIYAGMALISMATFALAYATANDALQEFLEDYVSICQLAIAGCFFFYVLFNFLGMMKQGINFQKVLYKPPFAKLILARIAAVFLIILIFGSKNYYSYFQIRAGYDNSIGDFYLQEGDLKAAETFYKSSTNFDLYNHKGNISLASIALNNKDRINAAFFFKQALQKAPSVFAFAGLSASLESENMYFDALFALKDGIKRFPKSSNLLNNLAFLQDKSNLKDSTIINLNEALKHCNDCSVEQTNYFAFWIENAKLDRLQEMADMLKPINSVSADANRAAISKMLNKKYELKSLIIPKDSSINVSTAALIYNSCSNALATLPNNFTTKTLKSLQQQNANGSFLEDLSWSFATENYYRGLKTEGIKQLTLMANSNLKNAKIYNQNLGLWLLKEGAFTQGIGRLKLANDTESAAILEQPKYKADYENYLAQTATQICKDGITLENYKVLANKAPLNPVLLAKIADYLSPKKHDLEAYKLVFYATELNPDSPQLWQIYIKEALVLHQFDFAEDGLSKLKPLVSASEYASLRKEIDAKKYTNNTFE